MRKAVCIAAALFVLPHAASAQLTMTVSPATIHPGTPVTLTVVSKVPCDFVFIFGDGSKWEYQKTPHTFTHKYALEPNATYPKDYHVQAYGGSPVPCQGAIDKMVTVHKEQIKLNLSPVIEEVFPFSNVTPGGIVAVKGWFGPQQAGAKLQILLPDSTTMSDLKVSSWTNTLIVGKLDPAIEGQFPGSAQFRVVNGKMGEWFKNNKGLTPIQFRPTMQSVMLVPTNIKTNKCSDDAGMNYCNGVIFQHINIWSALANSPTIIAPKDFIVTVDTNGTAVVGSSIHGYHVSAWGATSDDDTDVYELHLKSGWKIEQVVFQVLMQDNGSVDVPTTMQVGASDGFLAVHYHIGSSGGSVAYAAFIAIHGPKGVPF